MRQARNLLAAAWQTHARTDVMATFFVQLDARWLSIVSLLEDRAVVKLRSGLADRRRPSGDVATKVRWARLVTVEFADTTQTHA